MLRFEFEGMTPLLAAAADAVAGIVHFATFAGPPEGVPDMTDVPVEPAAIFSRNLRCKTITMGSGDIIRTRLLTFPQQWAIRMRQERC